MSLIFLSCQKSKEYRWAGSLQPTDKISDNLKNLAIGKWAQVDKDHVVLTIQFHNDTKVSDAENTIKRLGGNVTGVVAIIPSITAIFGLGQVKELASEDSVQFYRCC